MKKQLFSLVMVLALIVIAGTSAWAQSNVGTMAAHQYQFPGSSHTFSVTADASVTASSWQVYDETNSANADIDDCVPQTAGPNVNSIALQWAEKAKGNYSIRLTQQNAHGCTTVRYFYVTIAQFDVEVYACDITGAQIMAAAPALAGCGQNAVYGPFDNKPLLIVPATNTITDPLQDGSLADVLGTSPYNRRYVAVLLHSSDIDLTLPANKFFWQFPFTLPTGTDFIRAVSLTAEATVAGVGPSTVTVTPIAGVGNGSQTKIILALDFNVRWGIDIPFNFNIGSALTKLSTDGTLYTAGTEPSYDYSVVPDNVAPFANQTSIQTFYGSPATSVITSN